MKKQKLGNKQQSQKLKLGLERVLADVHSYDGSLWFQDNMWRLLLLALSLLLSPDLFWSLSDAITLDR